MSDNVLNKDIVLKDLDGTQLWPLAHRDSGGYIIEQTYLKNYVMKDGVKYYIDPDSLMYLSTGSEGDIIKTITGSTVNIVNSVEYGISNSPDEEPSTWSLTMPSNIPNGSYLWTKTTYSNGTVSYSISYQGINGTPAYNYFIQPSVDSIIYEINESGSPFVPNTLTFNFKVTAGDSAPSPYSSGYYIVSASSDGSVYTQVTGGTGTGNSVTINSLKTTVGTAARFIKCELYSSQGGALLDTETISILVDGTNGAAGVTINRVEEYYTLTTSVTPAPVPESSEWDWVLGEPGVPLPTMDQENKYLWNYEKVIYNTGDDFISQPVIIGAYGDSGKGIKLITNYYLASSITNPELLPPPVSESSDPEWSTNFQQVSESAKYLWNYEEIVYTDDTGDTIENTDPAIIGMFSKDGTNGTDAYTVLLTNENHTFILGTVGTTAGSIVAYKGTERISTSVGTIINTDSSNITFTVNDNNTNHATYTVTTTANLTSGGTITVPVTAGGASFSLIFSYSVVADAVIYYLQSDADVINVNQTGGFLPNIFTLNGFKQVGNDSPTDYYGRFEVDSTTDFINWQYFAGQSLDTKSLQVSLQALDDSVVALRCRLYESLTPIPASSSAIPLDTQTILFVHDGKDSYNISFSNDNLSFAGTSSAAIPTSITTYINAYRGTTRVAAEILPTGYQVIDLPTGMTITPHNEDYSSEYPAPTITVTVTSSLTTQSGTVYIPVKVDNQIFDIPLTYNVNFRGADGESPTTYSVVPSYNYILIDNNNNILPSDTVHFAAYTQTGTTKSSYPVIFKLYTKPLYTGDVPENYNEYEWINPSGQIRITGIKTTQNTKIESKWYRTSSTAQYIYYSDSNSSGSTNTTAYLSSSGGNWRFGNKTISWSPAISTIITSIQSKDGITSNGVLVDTYSTISNFTSTDDLKIAASGAGNVRYYYLKMWEGQTLVADLVPVERKSDNVFGFYNKVNGDFYYTPGLTVTHGDLIPSSESSELEEGWLNVYTSASNEEDCSYLIDHRNISGIKAEIYRNNTLLDSEAIPVIIQPSDGSDGVGINSVSIMYAVVEDLSQIESSQTEWSPDMPTEIAEGWYLVTRTITDYTDPSMPDTINYTYSRQGVDGEDGYDGSSVTVTAIEYQEGTSATTPPTGTWSSNPVQVSPGNYLWTRTTIEEGIGSATTTRYMYSVAYRGTNGTNGTNGQSVFIRYSNNASGNPMLQEGQTGKYIGICVNDTAPTSYTGYDWTQLEGIDGTTPVVSGTSTEYAQTETNSRPNPESSAWQDFMPDPIPNYYMWVKLTVNFVPSGSYTTYTVSKNGNNGKGITGVTEYYLATTDTNLPQDPDWETSITATGFNETNKYLWNYEEISYTVGNPTSTLPAIIAVWSKDGKGITDIQDWYLATNETNVNNLPPKDRSPWTTTVQTVSQSRKYLWNYEKITYTEGSPTSTTPVIIGNWSKDGEDGKSISDITEYYYAYSSSTTLPDNPNWQTSIRDLNPPFSETNKYLWNYERIDFESPYPDTTTTPQVISVYGRTGRGIASITEYYLASNLSSGITVDSSEWGTNIPTLDKNHLYLWNYELITYTDNTTSHSDPAIISRFSTSGSHMWTSSAAPTGQNNTFNISDLTGDTGAVLQVGDIVFYGTDRYTVTSIGSTTVNCGLVESLEGPAGYSNATIYLYKRGATAPATPTGTFTYTFSTGSLEGKTGTNPDLKGWVRTPNAAPADSENNPLWVTLASASSNYDADDILQSEWQNPIQLEGINGVDGTDGVSVIGVNEYYQVTTTSTPVPSTENFPSGWSPSLSGLTFDQDHPYLWNVETTSYSNSTTSQPTTPVIIGTWGQDGAPGSDGNDGADGVGIEWIKEYYQVTSSDSIVPSNSGLPDTLGSWIEVPGTGSTPTRVPTTSSTDRYLWNCEVLHWTNDTNTITSPAIVGVHSEDTIVYSLVVSDDAIIRNTNVSSNRLTPSTLTVTATKQIGAAAPQSYTGGTITLTAYTAGGSISTFSSGSTIPDKINNNDVVKIKATLTVSGTEVDSQTIPVINSGTNGQNAAPVYTVWLSNENHTFPADKDGHPISGSNSTTSTIYVYKDGVRVSASNISITSGTGTSSGLTITRTSGTNNLNISVDNDASLNGSRTITIRTDSIDFPVTFSYSLAVTGATGEQGPPGLAGYNQATIYLYQRMSLQSGVPSRPSHTVYYKFSDGELYANSDGTGEPNLDGWSREIPSGNYPCYVTSVSVVSREGITPIAVTSSPAVNPWSEVVKLVQDGQDGNAGNKVAVVNAYQRAATAPTTPPDLAVYTFLTNGLAAKNQGGSLHGWSTTMPADDGSNNPVWLISAAASSAGTTDDIESTEWQPRNGNNVAPIKYVQSGTNGVSVTEVHEYYYASTSTTDPGSQTEWEDDIQSTGFGETNKYLWNYEETIFSDPSYNSSTSPAIIAVWSKDGAAGKGISAIKEYYQANNSSSPPTKPTESSTTGWTEVPGTGPNPNPVPTTDASNKYLWNCEMIIWTEGAATITEPALIGMYTSDAVSYSVVPSDDAIIRNTNNSNSLSPNYITVSALKHIGTTTQSYTDGTITVSYQVSGSSTWTTITKSNNRYTIPSSVYGTIQRLKATLSISGVEVDSQTIPVINTGTDATPTYTAFLNNENQTFSSDYQGYISAEFSVDSVIYIYKGSTRLNASNVTYTCSDRDPNGGDDNTSTCHPKGMDISRSDNTITFEALQGYNLASQGTVTCHVTATDGYQVDLVFSYSKAIGGNPGTAAINQAVVMLYTKSSNPVNSSYVPENIKYTFSSGSMVAPPTGTVARYGTTSNPFYNINSAGTAPFWYTDIPDGDDVCYITSGVAIAQAATATVSSWSEPKVFIKNGVDADPVYYVTTDNDSHIFPSLDGKAYSGSDYSTTINVKAWSGSTQVAFSSFSVTSTTGSTNSSTLVWSATDGADGKTKILTVTPGTNLTTNSGTFTITGTPSGSSESFTKTFSWSLGLVGTTSYWLTSSVNAFTRNINNSANSTARTLSPTSVTFNSYSKVAGGTSSAYRGRFKLEKKSNTGAWTSITTNNNSEWTYTSINANGRRFSPSNVTLLSNSTTTTGTGVTLDLNITKDGATSSTVTLPAGQYYLSIPVTMTTSAAATVASARVAVYSGSTRLYTGTAQSKSTTATLETKTVTLIFTLAAQTSNISFKIYYTLQAAGAISVTSNTYLQDETTQFRISLYEAGGTTNLFDQQIIPVINTGANGTNGTNGTNGISAGITNQNETFIDTIGEDVNFNASTNTSITAWGLNGNTATSPANVSVTYNGTNLLNADASDLIYARVGTITTAGAPAPITITFNTGFPGNTGSSNDINSGVITIGFTVSGKSFSFPYTFSLVYEGKFPVESMPIYIMALHGLKDPNSSLIDWVPTKPTIKIVNSNNAGITSDTFAQAGYNINDYWSIKRQEYVQPIRKSGTPDPGSEGYVFSWDYYDYYEYWTCTQTEYSDSSVKWSDPVLDDGLNGIQLSVTETSVNLDVAEDKIASKVDSTTYEKDITNGETGLLYRTSQVEQTAGNITSFVGAYYDNYDKDDPEAKNLASLFAQTEEDVTLAFKQYVDNGPGDDGDPNNNSSKTIGGTIKLDLYTPTSGTRYTRITLGSSTNSMKGVFTNRSLEFIDTSINTGQQNPSGISGSKVAWIDSDDGGTLGAANLSIGNPNDSQIGERWNIKTRLNGTHLTFTRHSS